MTQHRTEYQRGYKAAIDRKPFQQNESEEWKRGFGDGMLDLAAAAKARSLEVL